MKTVTVDLSVLISNFSSSMIDHILSNDDAISMEDDTETFLRDLRNLINGKRGQTADTLRRLFRNGFTMMMLSPDDFNFLETADAEGEDFSIVVKNLLDKETVCILCKNEINW